MAAKRAQVEVEGHTIDFSNPDKVLFPADGITKADLVEYYRRIAEVMVPHLRGRPLMLQRFPDGIEASGFYQKNASKHFPDWIPQVELPKEGGTVDHVVCNDAATLVYLASQACITPHAWLSRADLPDHPDRLIFDLDPSDDDFGVVKLAARAVRKRLEDLGLVPFVQTSGSRGLHVFVPLDRSADFDTVRAFSHQVAEEVAAEHPDLLTVEARKAKREGRLYLDIQRNAYAQTTVSPYGIRARAGAPVATPLEWTELADSDLGPQRYTITNIFRRLSRREDPWADIGSHALPLPKL
jgi:bifunctional non-homologous end joining protein LigD